MKRSTHIQRQKILPTTTNNAILHQTKANTKNTPTNEQITPPGHLTRNNQKKNPKTRKPKKNAKKHYKTKPIKPPSTKKKS